MIIRMRNKEKEKRIGYNNHLIVVITSQMFYFIRPCNLFIPSELPFHSAPVQSGAQKFWEASSAQPARPAIGRSVGRRTGDSAEGRARGVCVCMLIYMYLIVCTVTATTTAILLQLQLIRPKILNPLHPLHSYDYYQ